VPSTNHPGFEPGVDAPTRRALYDLRRRVSLVSGLKIVGTIPGTGPPVAPGETPGDIIIDGDGNGWSWDGDSWVNIGPIQGPVGPQGPQGPPGSGGGGAAGFTHNQGTPAATWTITHNLGYFPNVTVEDSGGSTVEGELVHLSNIQLQLTFSAAFSGIAFLS
jgi:hypothetical protein